MVLEGKFGSQKNKKKGRGVWSSQHGSRWTPNEQQTVTMNRREMYALKLSMSLDATMTREEAGLAESWSSISGLVTIEKQTRNAISPRSKEATQFLSCRSTQNYIVSILSHDQSILRDLKVRREGIGSSGKN
jgi:hypothetical protein